MSGLEELFAKLKQKEEGKPPTSSQQGDSYRQPSVSSPVFSPPSHTPNPVHSSNIISPANPSSSMGTPAPEGDRTANLLNLLKFNNNAQASQPPGPMENLQNVGRSGSMHLPTARDSSPRASDYTASIRREASTSGVKPSPGPGAGAHRQGPAPTSGNSDFLLNLLRQPNASAATPPAQSGSAQPAASSTGDAQVDSLARSFAETSLPSREPAPFDGAAASQPVVEAPQPTKANMFSYVNPFDQLHSSSPLNRSPKPPTSQADTKKMEILKHDRTVSSNLNGEASAPAAKHRKLTSPSPKPGEPERGPSVSEALEEAGEKVDKQVEQALADAAAKENGGRRDGESAIKDEEDDTVIKKEKGDDDLESSWESAEEEAEKDSTRPVEVYNFPMKPFVQIQIKSNGTPQTMRQQESELIKISKIKKDFDQIDRCLASATQSHIAYAEVVGKKTSKLGLRIIRQDTGAHKNIFSSENERVFNVQLCGSADAASDVETVLGTGVNGSVFWASLSKSGGEVFAEDDIEKQGFIMPPIQTAEEVATGSPVKTRAKMSSRHPEYFAIARGKQIHIIAPEKVMDKRYTESKSRKTIKDRYHQEHSLRIMTGKAGKDFCFSEDDTMIVSLDKSGRFKFWDIRDLTSRACDYNEERHDPVDLTEPIWSLNAAASGSRADEKPSVSSIMFLDKDRPVNKGIALRYMLIGFKQNHILQLWDLGLGKAVQEIRLPHEKDSDGICSITYHPKTGIVAIAHPTRNSLYFIHLSAPKYNVPSMDQARYVSCLARNDSTVPRPDSTAIMSGLREFSFAKFGQLRCIDMLKTPVPNGGDPDTDEAVLFELYIMHSKGILGLPIKRSDLGWDKDGKMVKPVDALKAGVIEVVELIQPHKLPPPSEQSSNADTPAKQPSKSAAKKDTAKQPYSAAAAKNEPVKREAAASTNGPARPGGSKQIPEAPLPSEQSSTNPPIITADSYAMAAQRVKSPAREQAVQDAANAAKRAAKSPEPPALAPHISSADDFQAMLTKQFDSLYQRIDADKRVQEAAGAAKQDAILRLVSSTLTENVEKSLSRIISGSVEKEVIPHLEKTSAQVLDKKLEATLPNHLNTTLSRELKSALPGAVQKALQDPSVSRAISEHVVPKVEQQVSGSLKQMLPGMISVETNKMKAELERRQVQQLNDAEVRRQQDQAKIQDLTSMVRNLSETVQQMSQSQTAFQEQILQMQREMSSRSEGAAKDTVQEVIKAEPKDEEAENITQLLQAGQYDAATMQVRHGLNF